MRPSDNFLQLLSSELDLTVTKLILSSWLSLELLFNDSVVSLLLTGAHTVKICRRWFVFADRLLNIKLVNVLNEFKFGLSHLKLHTQVKIVLDLLECHWRRPLRLLDLGRDPHVLLTIDALVLD